MNDQFKCVTINADVQEKYRDALSDILCWMNGFVQGGGEYSPETIYTLRDIRDMISRAYPTIPPTSEPMFIYTPEPTFTFDAAVNKATKIAAFLKHLVVLKFNEKTIPIWQHTTAKEANAAFDKLESAKTLDVPM